MRYTSYTHICVYMDITKDLLEGINLWWDDEGWFQALDYEHIPFRCRCCHEHGHLFRECLENNPKIQQKGKEVKDVDGFTKVSGKKRTAKRNQGPEVNKKPISSNAFDVLQSEQVQVNLDSDGSHKVISKNKGDKGGKEQSQLNPME